MAPEVRKRKVAVRDAPPSPEVSSGDEFQEGLLNGGLPHSVDASGSEDEDGGELEGDDDIEEDEPSDEEHWLSDEDEAEIREQFKTPGRQEPTPGTGSSSRANGDHDAADDQQDSDSDGSGFGGLTSNYTVTTDANGNPRYVYREIEPVYESDDSDAPATTNTIGNIPLSFYDAYPHIGYDINGKKIMRPAKGEALDSLLDSIEIPHGWTGLTDPATGQPLNLTEEELDVLKKLTRNEAEGEGYDPYPDMVEYFSGKLEIMPLSAAPEPKRRFVPSKHEAKRVMKIVKAIREGRIKPYRPPEEDEQDDRDVVNYDIWADEAPRPDHPMNIPAPKLPPPGYDESYHPPPEYLPDKGEKTAWETADAEDREKEYLPTDHDALRKVPGYETFVKERFERCLDLYLAPRVRRNRLNIDPESLLPKLPSPDELRPFPTTCATLYRGHTGRVRSVAIDPSGVYLASGGDDGTVRIWELLTGRQLWSVTIGSDEAVSAVRWRPGTDAMILSAAAGETIYFIVPVLLATPDVEQVSRDILSLGFGYAANKPAQSTAQPKEPPATWARPSSAHLYDQGVLLQAAVRSAVKVISWHRRGDYLVTVSPAGQSHAVAIHTLSQHRTQLPFRRLKGAAQAAQFHPSAPVLFVATQRQVRAYDLARGAAVPRHTAQPGARWVSSFDVHPRGDNLVVGSYDRRLLWHDLDLSSRPYRTLRYHAKAIRAVRFHPGGLPLFADASDDGTVQVFHGRVVDDLMENATIVPLKVLRGHRVTRELGVLDLDWHPRLPWLVSAGADGTCMLWN